VSWSIRFAEPIVLEDGSKLATLRDAIRYLAQIISKPEGDMLEVLMAFDLLTQAAEHDGPIEFARIATLQAINRHVERVFDPSRIRHALGKAEIKKGSVTKPGFAPDGIAETEAATVREPSNDQNGRCLEWSGLRFASRPSRSPRQMPIRCAITIHAQAITANNVATISKARPMHFAPGVSASDRAMMRSDGKGSKENPPGVNRRPHLSSSRIARTCLRPPVALECLWVWGVLCERFLERRRLRC
jgi:hypothetical protein